MPRVQGTVLCALLVASLAGCTQEAGSKADDNRVLADAPQWQPGYRWSWRSHDGADWDGSEEFQQAEANEMWVNGTVMRSISIDGAEGWLFDHHPTAHAENPSLVNPDTLASRHIFLGTEPAGHPSQGYSCVSYGFGVNEPPTFLPFPLEQGKHWHETERIKKPMEGRSGTLHVEGWVIGPEPVTVLSKRYSDAVRVEMRYWITADETGDRPSHPEHSLYTQPTVVHYSPSVMHVVKIEYGFVGFPIWAPGWRVTGLLWDVPEREGHSATLELDSHELVVREPSTIHQETERYTSARCQP